MRAPLLTQFVATRPRYVVTQERTLAWIAAAHAAAEYADPRERDVFAARLARVIERCACPPTKIFARGSSFNLEASWEDTGVYDLPRAKHGAGTSARTQRFSEIVDAYFAQTYADETEAPDEMVHVTCTGYVSPSGAQKVVAARRWPTRVVHAYQMGCYASVPAARIAAGLLHEAKRVDVVHTELCSLHFDPTDHSLEQLVVQSLFADGMIRYSMVPDDGRAGLRIRGSHEQIIPDSAGFMSWKVGDHGMQMTLAREVPERIAGALRGFMLELLRRSGAALADLKTCMLAVHPGGPKIIDRVREVLELDETQVAISREVLFDYGNMSSATLPHIWQRMLADPAIPRGTVIPSLAFGPGLTVCGAVLEKQ
jgi:predicted naringenin-chalcone synthase